MCMLASPVFTLISTKDTKTGWTLNAEEEKNEKKDKRQVAMRRKEDGKFPENTREQLRKR